MSDINPENIFKDNMICMMLNDGTKKHNVVALNEDSGGTTQETKNTEPTSSQLLSMSIKEARKELRKGAQLVIIREVLQNEIRMQIFVKLGLRPHESSDGPANRRVVLQIEN